MVNLDEVLTFSEAAEKWGLADGKTIRKAVERKKFKSYEIKKSGNVWLTTYDAMYRIYGNPKITSLTLSYFDLFNQQKVLEDFFEAASMAISEGKIVTVIESKEHPEQIMCILKTKKELDGWRKRLQFYLDKNKKDVR